jgi:hypothetical protein
MPARIAARPTSSGGSGGFGNNIPVTAESKREEATPARSTGVQLPTAAPAVEVDVDDESVSDAVSTPSQWSAEDFFADYRVSEESKSHSDHEGFDDDFSHFDVGEMSDERQDHAQNSPAEAEDQWTHEPDVVVRAGNGGRSEEQGGYDSADEMSIALSSDSGGANSDMQPNTGRGAPAADAEEAPSSHWTVSDVTAED